MADYNSKYTGEQVEQLLDQMANIPTASTSKYGVTKLSTATDSTSTSLAATPSAVKEAYDLANGKQDKVVSAGGTAKIDWNQDIDNIPGILDEGTYIDFNQPINIAKGFFFDSENSVAGGKLTFDNAGIHYEILGDAFLDVPATMDIIHTGDGTKFLSDDGTYKEVSGGGSGGITTETDPIFSASPAATITEEKIAGWNGKQDSISDLATIREGAALGATALQEHQDISNKQDTLVSGTNIKTINGNSLLGSGNIVISGGGEEVVSWDDIQGKPIHDVSLGQKDGSRLDTTAMRITTFDHAASEAISFTRKGITFYDSYEFYWEIHKNGNGTKFLADNGQYKEVYTKAEIDTTIGDINTILESIING